MKIAAWEIVRVDQSAIGWIWLDGTAWRRFRRLSSLKIKTPLPRSLDKCPPGR